MNRPYALGGPTGTMNQRRLHPAAARNRRRFPDLAPPSHPRPMPDADALARLHPDEAAAVARVLDDGETVRAVATPVPVRRPAVMTGALAFAAAALVVSIGLVASGAGVGMIVAAVLALVSLGAVGAADRWGRRTVAYAATDRRLLVVSDSGAGTPRADAVEGRALSKRRLDVRSTGRGTIRLTGSSARVRIGPIADVRAFNAVLDTLPGASPSRSDGAAGPATNLPAADAFRDADIARLARALVPGERVLWMGQPEPTWGTKQTMNDIQKKTLPALLPIFLLVAGFVLSIGLLGARFEDVARVVVPLFQITTVGYALWLTRQLRRRSLYVVTDRRALVGMPGLTSYDVRSFDGAALAGAATANGAGGRRSVVFASGTGEARTVPGYRGGRVRAHGWETWAGGPVGDGFEFIRDADAVVDLLRRVGAGEAPAGDLLARRLPEHAASSLHALAGNAPEAAPTRPPALRLPGDGGGEAPDAPGPRGSVRT